MFRLTSKKRLDEALELVASLQKQVGELTVKLEEAEEASALFMRDRDRLRNESRRSEKIINRSTVTIGIYQCHAIARDPKTGRIMNKVKSAEFFADAIQSEYRKQGLS